MTAIQTKTAQVAVTLNLMVGGGMRREAAPNPYASYAVKAVPRCPP